MCCWEDKSSTTTHHGDDQMNKHKERSRQLLNYIMYLIFKRGVLLSSDSQIVHNDAVSLEKFCVPTVRLAMAA